MVTYNLGFIMGYYVFPWGMLPLWTQRNTITEQLGALTAREMQELFFLNKTPFF